MKQRTTNRKRKMYSDMTIAYQKRLEKLYIISAENNDIKNLVKCIDPGVPIQAQHAYYT
jgi:hypothetical protein